MPQKTQKCPKNNASVLKIQNNAPIKCFFCIKQVLNSNIFVEISSLLRRLNN